MSQKKKELPPCPYNKAGVCCVVAARKGEDEECEHCGWNPDVSARRRLEWENRRADENGW